MGKKGLREGVSGSEVRKERRETERGGGPRR